MSKMEIPRKKWLNGTLIKNRVNGYSCLLNKDGEQCCLGMLATHLGSENEQILEVPAPSDIKGNIDFPEVIYDTSSNSIMKWSGSIPNLMSQDWESVLIDINDDRTIDNKTRESWIGAAFKYLFGIKVEFTGKYLNE
jgi:hypothetical protein